MLVLKFQPRLRDGRQGVDGEASARLGGGAEERVECGLGEGRVVGGEVGEELDGVVGELRGTS